MWMGGSERDDAEREDAAHSFFAAVGSTITTDARRQIAGARSEESREADAGRVKRDVVTTAPSASHDPTDLAKSIHEPFLDAPDAESTQASMIEATGDTSMGAAAPVSTAETAA